jgi:hypothetical protein
LSNIPGEAVSQRSFHLPPDKLVWIELGCIGRQEMDMEPRMASEKLGDTHGTMG